jgi:hypothetical protein
VVNVHQNGMPKDNSNQRQPYDTQRVLLPLMAFLTATAQRAYTIFFLSALRRATPPGSHGELEKRDGKGFGEGFCLILANLKLKKVLTRLLELLS